MMLSRIHLSRKINEKTVSELHALLFFPLSLSRRERIKVRDRSCWRSLISTPHPRPLLNRRGEGTNPQRGNKKRALSFRAERGMERVGRATWTAKPRGERQVSRETNEFNLAVGAAVHAKYFV